MRVRSCRERGEKPSVGQDEILGKIHVSCYRRDVLKQQKAWSHESGEEEIEWSREVGEVVVVGARRVRVVWHRVVGASGGAVAECGGSFGEV